MFNLNNITNEYDIEQWTLFLEKVIGNNTGWIQILTAAVLIIIFIVGFIGNFLTCTVIYCDKKMHTITNHYIFNMAATDLLVSFGISLEVYLCITDSYLFGNIACKIHCFFVVLLWNNSILVMTTLAIERYFAIWYPLSSKYVPSMKRARKIITVIWIISICETIPELWTVELVKTEKMSYCFIVPSSLARVISGVLALVTFVIPLTIMLFVYIMIALKVNNSEKSNSRRTIFNHKNNRRKVNKLVVAITISFLICWLPFFCNRLLFFFCDMQQLMQLDRIWDINYRTLLINSWFSIILNPIIFSLMSSKFRNSLLKLWRTKFKRRPETIYL
ncbi:neuromedin-U receptor 2-like [Vanessa cardui]|uniref:neuromedin-U receptor 2-like n=1 Tax=Vanessa cardui TaxID=171605 RepID=UPI001F12CFE3|nr:neuromedin-U receptor 2-like [Vanessa cardui]